jgi:hypothetical protein
VSVLHDISIYVDTPEQSLPLADVLRAVADRFGDELPTDSKGSNAELASFMGEAVPDYDRERVRVSDIKKLISWYTILRQYAPELFEAKADEEAGADANAAADEETTQETNA